MIKSIFLQEFLEWLLLVLGITGNVTSIILWIPQAKQIWLNRHDPKALRIISIGTQKLVALNTLVWCSYGLLKHDFWLPIATIFILPCALLTIYWKKKAVNKERETEENEPSTWFSFAAYCRLNEQDKERCLEAMYNTDFIKLVHKESLNWESYESMSELDRMYWDKELWCEKYEK
ncbi:hypothetical protein [Enterococcus termitis]|uniref:Uncharacterized protein n=1 Tax=Enterococcus termitis TaxID=332950 RepID=A0A1E5H1H7_9ENTE|nr:hypothetical protein [Enterococcus termitis]OEG18675.1 hypothetical protein BCR25_15855 [Enterococcus termitis]